MIFEEETELVWIQFVDGDYAAPAEDGGGSETEKETKKSDPPACARGVVAFYEPGFVLGGEFGGDCGRGERWF